MMDFDDIDAFSAHLRTLPSKVRKAQRLVLQKYAAEVKADARRVLGTYENGWPQLKASTQAGRILAGFPGNEPLLVTGALRDSIHYNTTETKAVIGSALEYAAAQEEGYPKGKIPPRPYLKPAARKVVEKFVDEVGNAVAHALAGMSVPTTTTGGGTP